MKKQTLFKVTAIALAVGFSGLASATSATGVTSVPYAQELFQGTTPTSAIVGPTINIISGTALPSGSVVTAMIELTGGSFGVTIVSAAAAADKLSSTAQANPIVAMGSSIAGVTAVAAGVTAQTATASNANVLVVQFTTTTAVGVGGTLATLTTPSLNAPGLASTSATVTANVSVFLGAVAAPVGTAVPTTGLVEPASGAATVATSVVGVTLTSAANSAASTKIDLTASPVGSKFSVGTASTSETASTTLVKLGTLTITDGLTGKLRSNAGLYTQAGKLTTTTTTVATVTAPAGFFAALGTTGVITTRVANATACNGAAVGTSATFASAAAAAAATTVSTPAAAHTATTTGVSWDVCMSVNGTTPIIVGTPTLTAVLGGATNTIDSVDSLASTSMFALSQNGQSRSVRLYVPSTKTGFAQSIRVVNTGAIAAPVTITMTGEDGVQIGVPYTTTSFNVGESRRITQAQLETGVGVVPIATARPRLTVTAPTNAMDVQSLMFMNNVYTNMSGVD